MIGARPERTGSHDLPEGSKRLLYFPWTHIRSIGGDMDRVRPPILNAIYQEKGSWKIHCLDAVGNEPNLDANEQWRIELPIFPAMGPDRLTRKEAQPIAGESFLSRLRRDKTAAQNKRSAI